MFIRARANLATAQGRYKCDCEKRVRTILRVRAGEKIFLANLLGLAHDNTAHTDALTQSKLGKPASDPHEFNNSTDTTTTISVDGVHEIMSLHRLALALHVRHSPDMQT